MNSDDPIGIRTLFTVISGLNSIFLLVHQVRISEALQDLRSALVKHKR